MFYSERQLGKKRLHSLLKARINNIGERVEISHEARVSFKRF
jgi:hypothetical protein